MTKKMTQDEMAAMMEKEKEVGGEEKEMSGPPKGLRREGHGRGKKLHKQRGHMGDEMRKTG